MKKDTNIEERAYSEARVVKMEILESFENAVKYLSNYIRYKELKRVNLRAFADFKQYTLEMYLKINKLENIEDIELIDNVKKYLLGEKHLLKDTDWINLFFILKKYIHDLGITKIEMPVSDPSRAVLER